MRCRERSRLIPDLSMSNSVSMMNLLRRWSLFGRELRWLRLFRQMPVTTFWPRRQSNSKSFLEIYCPCWPARGSAARLSSGRAGPGPRRRRQHHQDSRKGT